MLGAFVDSRIIELAWAAGFFDGEGSASVLKAQRDKYAYPRLSLSQKNIIPLERFHKAVGYGKIYKSKTRDIYNWNLYRTEDVEHVCSLLNGYLSEPKRNQINEMFRKVEEHNAR